MGGTLTEKQIKAVFETFKLQTEQAMQTELSILASLQRMMPQLQLIETDTCVYIHDGSDLPLNTEEVIYKAEREAALAHQARYGAANYNANEKVPEKRFAPREQRGHDEGPAVGVQPGQQVDPKVQAALAEMELEDLQQARDDQGKAKRALRREWDMNQRDLPKSAIRMTIPDVIALTQRIVYLDPRVEAIRTLAGEVRRAVSQEVLSPWTSNNDVSLGTRYRVATASVRSAVSAFGLIPNEIVPDQPTDDVVQPAEPFNPATMNTIDMWSRPSRPGVN